MRRRVLPILCAFVLLAVPFASVAQSGDSPVLVGKVFKVTDGDTIKVQLQSGPINVRLDSIDAPESNQPHGAEAKAALATMVANREVQLEVVSQDRYERLVAIVYVGDLNVNEQMVQQGHAWAYRQYLKNRQYCEWEGAARQQRLGLWALPTSDWIFPSDWRRLRRNQIDEPQDFSNETVAACKAAVGKRRPTESSR
jgi:endonuclease YncB( thermonuclease family)